MSEVTRLLEAVDRGDPQAAGRLLPLVYDELRRLAAQKLAHEKPGQTLDATALVHEAYLRLVGDQAFANRRHFFAAAAEAMRRLLVERARRKGRLRHGGGLRQVELRDDLPAADEADAEVLAVDEALDQLARHDPEAAELVRLHFFAGLTIERAADLLGVSPRTAYRNWQYARAWLFRRLSGAGGEKPGSPGPPTAHGRVAHPEEAP
jgi:RNA polymerase sigma factor (TIGR02999 family)